MSLVYNIKYTKLYGGDTKKPCSEIDDKIENGLYNKIRCLTTKYGKGHDEIKKYIKSILNDKTHPEYEVLRKPILINKLNKIDRSCFPNNKCSNIPLEKLEEIYKNHKEKKIGPFIYKKSTPAYEDVQSELDIINAVKYIEKAIENKTVTKKKEKEKILHVMSITKAAIGLMYHIHEKEFPRYNLIESNGDPMFSIGAALNMMTGYDDNEWNFDDYRKQVESSANLEVYSKQKLSNAKKISTWKYNNLAYQLLASNMPDVADRFGKFMGDKAGIDLIKETHTLDYYKENGEHIVTHYDVWFKSGKSWKWEHTSDGQPLGPHGLWMTPSFSKKLGEKARQYFNSTRGERIQIPSGKGWGNYITESKIKQYWNGWWLSKRCVYAIGHVCQVIAVTPKDVRVQIYDEDWSDPLDNEKNWEKEEWFFIDKIEEEFKT
jgi:hypothetical protein